jgi:guanosine-3',5'-bis(diphosphate) 3'-pyrophosphohydrolase
MPKTVTFKYDTSRYTPEQNDLIQAAFDVAEKAHEGQKRRSGEPYLIHPVAVAETVAGWGLDHETVAAALLHDVVEDTETALDELAGQFGPRVAHLVDGVTKMALSKMPSLATESNRLEVSKENLRKLLLATAKDHRVIMLKLADRLHNLRTLEYMPVDKQRRIARESLAIFAPLADRLGMGQLKAEMEDLSFKYAQPEEYVHLQKLVKSTTAKSAHYLTLLKHDVRQQLATGGVEPISIEARQKHLYSIQKKLVKTGGDIEKMYDLTAVRIIVADVAACYQTLGLIHQVYKPLIYRIKDYIAVPKPNGYQSLHTTVFALDGHIIEIQIRTPQMHEEAEHGLAAHFFYDAQKASANYAKGEVAKVPEKLGWVNQLAKMHQAADDGQDFLEDGAHLELFAGQIYVFSPRGDLYELPEGATPVDFAFAIHSNLGLRAMGAKVNGRMVTLDARLENRDVVEIMTRRESAPNRDWLNFVKTSHAKNRIRSWFRAVSRETNVASGRTALETELKAWSKGRLEDLPKAQVAEALDALHLKSVDDMLAVIGEGSLTVTHAIRKLVPDAARPASVAVVKRPVTTGRVMIEGEQLPYTLGVCCAPVFPQPLVGYVTRGSGVTVHALGCRNLPNDAERFITCRWETTDGSQEHLLCQLEMECANRIGLLSDLTSAVAERRLNISGLTSKPCDKPDVALISFAVEVVDLFELAELMRHLERVVGVLNVKRSG